MHIRKSKVRDKTAVIRIARKFASEIGLLDKRAMLEEHMGTSKVIVACGDDDRPIGFVYAYMRGKGHSLYNSGRNHLYVSAICVDAKHHRQGVGASLMRELAASNSHRLIKGSVPHSNEAGVGVYNKAGFTQASTRIHFAKDAESKQETGLFKNATHHLHPFEVDADMILPEQVDQDIVTKFKDKIEEVWEGCKEYGSEALKAFTASDVVGHTQMYSDNSKVTKSTIGKDGKYASVKEFEEAIVKKATINGDEIGTFWVITKPTPESELTDILMETDISNMMLQSKGGLMDEGIIGVYKNGQKAKMIAQQLIQDRDAGLESTSEASKKVAGLSKKAELEADEVGNFWVVIKPSEIYTELDDLVFESNVVGMAYQFLGGLERDEIVGIYKDSQTAHTAANQLLTERDSISEASKKTIARLEKKALEQGNLPEAGEQINTAPVKSYDIDRIDGTTDVILPKPIPQNIVDIDEMQSEVSDFEPLAGEQDNADLPSGDAIDDNTPKNMYEEKEQEMAEQEMIESEESSGEAVLEDAPLSEPSPHIEPEEGSQGLDSKDFLDSATPDIEESDELPSDNMGEASEVEESEVEERMNEDLPPVDKNEEEEYQDNLEAEEQAEDDEDEEDKGRGDHISPQPQPGPNTSGTSHGSKDAGFSRNIVSSKKEVVVNKRSDDNFDFLASNK